MNRLDSLILSKRILDQVNTRLLSVFEKGPPRSGSVYVFGADLSNIEKKEFYVTYFVSGHLQNRWFHLLVSWDFLLDERPFIETIAPGFLPEANKTLALIFDNASREWSEDRVDAELELIRSLPTPPFYILK
jgi:hypothetical protein